MLSIWCRIFFPTGSVCPGYLPLHPSSFFTDPSLLVLLIIPIDLQRARKPFWSLEHWCAIKSWRGEFNLPNSDKSDEMVFKIFCQIAKLVASRNHMAGYDLSHELFKSAYDIEFYSGLCIWSKVEVAFLCPFRGSWKWELPNTSCETVASVFGMFITLFLPSSPFTRCKIERKKMLSPFTLRTWWLAIGREAITG